MVEIVDKSKTSEIEVDVILEKIKNKTLKVIERNKDSIPYMAKGSHYSDKASENIGWWTNGFFAGSLWQLYSHFELDAFKEHAIHTEVLLDQVLEGFYRIDHDAGFMWLHTAVANYRKTGNEESRLRGIKAASAFSSRFNMRGSFLRAWNRPEGEGWAIIDSMMNLPILFWASEELADPRLADVAVEHANTLQEHLVRPDGSTGHIVSFDTETGEFVEQLAGQGYAPGSSWSRGQGWAVYGFALAYKYTKDEKYLETAKRAAHYFLANVSQTGHIPRIDFRAPDIESDTDTSAGLIAACGMLEISKYVSEEEKDLYIEGSKDIVQSTIEEFGNFDEEIDGIVYGSAVGYRPHDERGISLVYADYFLIEYLLKLQNKEFDLW